MKTGLKAWKVKAADFPREGIQAEKLQFLVNYAVLAPSKYNAQPWLFEICGDSLDIICDRDWALRETDPQGRELILSCGAALENLGIAATYFGHSVEIQTFPWPGDRHLLARVRLVALPETEATGAPDSNRARTAAQPLPTPDWNRALREQRPDASAARNSLPEAPDFWSTAEPSNEEYFKAISTRCTSRRPFWPGTPPKQVLDACAKAAALHGAWLHFITEEPARQAIAELVAQGAREQMANKGLRRESSRWVHAGPGKSNDGFPLSRFGLPGPMSLLTPGFSFLLGMFNLGTLVAAHDRRLVQSGPVLAVLGTEEDTPEAWLAAGQAMQLALLRATTAGLSSSFFSQPIAVAHLRTQLGQLTGHRGFPQMLLRLGYGRTTRHTPRRPAQEVVI